VHRGGPGDGLWATFTLRHGRVDQGEKLLAVAGWVGSTKVSRSNFDFAADGAGWLDRTCFAAKLKFEGLTSA
jgi:hypothetical protein